VYKNKQTIKYKHNTVHNFDTSSPLLTEIVEQMTQNHNKFNEEKGEKMCS